MSFFEFIHIYKALEIFPTCFDISDNKFFLSKNIFIHLNKYGVEETRIFENEHGIMLLNVKVRNIHIIHVI